MLHFLQKRKDRAKLNATQRKAPAATYLIGPGARDIGGAAHTPAHLHVLVRRAQMPQAVADVGRQPISTIYLCTCSSNLILVSSRISMI